MLYCFKVDTLQGVKEYCYSSLEEAQKNYNLAMIGILDHNNRIYGLSRLYTKRK